MSQLGAVLARTVLLPDGTVLCRCGELHESLASAAGCASPQHRPRWHKKVAAALAMILCVLMFGALLGCWVAIVVHHSPGYRIPDSGYPFPASAP